jgi:hypothetical protein
MGQYETFVIRLWIEADSRDGHGEVRHLATGKELRFQKIEQALHFIERVAASQQPAEKTEATDRRLDRRLIDFGPAPSGGDHGE